MKSTPYAAGRRAEYKCLAHLRDHGWRAVRTAGSHGPFDVIAWAGHDILFIQVKKVSSVARLHNALEQSRITWAKADLTHTTSVRLETWIRLKGYWYIYPYPFQIIKRRIK